MISLFGNRNRRWTKKLKLMSARPKAGTPEAADTIFLGEKERVDRALLKQLEDGR